MEKELLQEELLSLFNSLTYTDVDVSGQQKVILFLEGLPILEAEKDGDMVANCQLFPAFSKALKQESLASTDNSFGCPHLPKYVLLSLLKRLLPSGPCPFEKFLDNVAFFADRFVNQNVNDYLQALTIDQLVHEAPKRNAARNEMTEIAIELIAETIDPDDIKELPLSLGQRNIVITPILYDDEKDKFLFLLRYGSIDNPVTLAAFWNDVDDKVRCDPKLSRYFNYRVNDHLHPWMQWRSLPLQELISYLANNPDVFDGHCAPARRKGLTSMVFDNLKKWIDPHVFFQTLFDCSPWMEEIPTFDKSGRVTTTYAMGLINSLINKELELLKANAALKEQEQPSTLN